MRIDCLVECGLFLFSADFAICWYLMAGKKGLLMKRKKSIEE
jgi:hypothetical protein